MSVHVTERLSAYLDGALGAGDLERVEGHLETCPECRSSYGELQMLQGLLRRLPEPVPAPGLAERLHWRLRRESKLRTRRDVLAWFSVRPIRFALAGATLLVVLGLPFGWMATRLATREAPLDTDAYLREYLVLSADRPLGDEVATTLVTSDTLIPEPPLK